MNPHEQFLSGLPRAIAVVTAHLLDLSREMGADFKKIGWFAPYDGVDHDLETEPSTEELELADAVA
jgi:hypothetical protein